MAGIPLQGGQRVAAAHVTIDLSAPPGPPPFPAIYLSSDGFDESAGITSIGPGADGQLGYVLTLSQSINYARSIIIVTPAMLVDPGAPSPHGIDELFPTTSGAIGAFPDSTVTEGNTITVVGNDQLPGSPGFVTFYVAVFKIN